MVANGKAAHKVVDTLNKNFNRWLAALSESYSPSDLSSRLPEQSPRCSRCPHAEDEEEA